MQLISQTSYKLIDEAYVLCKRECCSFLARLTFADDATPEHKQAVSFRHCYNEAEAVLRQKFIGSENRSYFEECCLSVAAWQIAASITPTLEVPKLVFSENPQNAPAFIYPNEEK